MILIARRRQTKSAACRLPLHSLSLIPAHTVGKLRSRSSGEVVNQAPLSYDEKYV